MEFENKGSSRTYIQLLVVTLKKKTEILDYLIHLTEKQELIIANDDFNDEEFLQVVSLKEDSLRMLDELDNGFEQVYARVKEEITNQRYQYEAEIKEIQALIMKITDDSVRLQVLEKRNKSKLEQYFANQRRQIKASKANSQTVANYYKTMTKQNEVPSFFYDKKN